MKRTRQECKNEITDFIKQKPFSTVDEIEKELHVNIHRLFGGIINAFEAAGVNYPRYNNNKKLATNIKQDLTENPLLTVDEIQKKYKFSFYKRFESLKKFCKELEIKHHTKHQKRRMKKQNKIIAYVQKHPESTQWEINNICKTHVQKIFDGGIREAFEKSGTDYPESRRILYGTAKASIKRRALIFQNRVINLLKKIGTVETQVKTKNGIADAVFHYKNKIIPIEIKDYRKKPISNSEIKQITKYIDDLNCNTGIIISSSGDRKEFKLASNKSIKLIPIKYISQILEGL